MQSPIVEEGDLVVAAEVMVALDTPLVPWVLFRSCGVHKVVSNIGAGSRGSRCVRIGYASNLCENRLGVGRKTFLGNDVVREWRADSNSILDTCGCGVVDRHPFACRVNPVAEVTSIHLGRRNAK